MRPTGDFARARAVFAIAAGLVLLAGLPTGVRAEGEAATGMAPPAIGLEPKALEIIKAACNAVAAARTLSFKSVVAEESPSRLGPPLEYLDRYDVTLQRPNKLRILNPGDGPPSDFYYDGRTMHAFAPKENYIAQAPAPATIDAALEEAGEKAQIYFPFADLIVADPYKDLSEGLRVAFYVGQSESVGGTTTDIVAYANDHVWVQAWIGAKDHLPRRLRAIYRKDPAQLRHQMDIHDWTLNQPVPASAFAIPEAARKALPIPFERPQPMPGASGPAGN
jgi:hypothetical protein